MFATPQSETKSPKRRRKIIVVKKAQINPSNTSEFDNRSTKHSKGSKVFVKRVKKLREPRKAQNNSKTKDTQFSTSSLFDDIRKQLVFKSSGYVIPFQEKAFSIFPNYCQGKNVLHYITQILDFQTTCCRRLWVSKLEI